jgi:hypothetical protein
MAVGTVRTDNEKYDYGISDYSTSNKNLSAIVADVLGKVKATTTPSVRLDGSDLEFDVKERLYSDLKRIRTSNIGYSGFYLSDTRIITYISLSAAYLQDPAAKISPLFEKLTGSDFKKWVILIVQHTHDYNSIVSFDLALSKIRRPTPSQLSDFLNCEARSVISPFALSDSFKILDGVKDSENDDEGSTGSEDVEYAYSSDEEDYTDDFNEDNDHDYGNDVDEDEAEPVVHDDSEFPPQSPVKRKASDLAKPVNHDDSESLETLDYPLTTASDALLEYLKDDVTFATLIVADLNGKETIPVETYDSVYCSECDAVIETPVTLKLHPCQNGECIKSYLQCSGSLMHQEISRAPLVY